MNAIERGLLRPIPLEKAASFFVGLKSWCQPSQEEDELMAACVKQAAADQLPQKVPLAQEAPADAASVDPQPHLNVKSASLRFRLLANSIKKQAADETAPSEDSGDAQLSSPTPAEVPQQDSYLANEEQGIAAENGAALQYYQQRLEEARAETAAATEQAQELQGQVEQLTMAQEQHDSQVAAANQEGQIAQQAAVQQVDAANLAASQAMNQAVQASNQALQAKSQEAAAKIEVQGVRSQLFDLAAQGLPGTEPQLGGAGGAAEGVAPLEPTATPEADAEGAPAEEGVEGGEGAGGEEAATEEGGNAQDAEAQAGAPDSGQNQAGESASADGMPGSQGATEQAAAAAPGAVPPQGGGGSEGGDSNPPQASSSGSGSGSSDAKRQGQISIKVGSATERRAHLQVQLPWLAKTAGFGAEGIGALAGGVLGAGAAALEGAGHGPSLDKMRAGIAEHEAAPKRTGMRGFGDALALVQEKARLGLGEATQAHPLPATIVGGLGGAALGASAGPKIRDLLREAASFHRGA